MKDTLENRKFIIDYFKGSEFTSSDTEENPSSPHPFMLFGKGWGQYFLKVICIQFETENMKSHIEIEFSPCVAPSTYYYMDLTKENIQKLPKTDKEYFERFDELMKRGKECFLKGELKS